MEPVAEQPHLRLHIEAGHCFAYPFRRDNPALLLRDHLRRGLDEEIRVLLPRLDRDVARGPRQVVEAEIIRPVLVDLREERRGREIAVGRVIVPYPIPLAATAVLDLIPAAD